MIIAMRILNIVASTFRGHSLQASTMMGIKFSCEKIWTRMVSVKQNISSGIPKSRFFLVTISISDKLSKEVSMCPGEDIVELIPHQKIADKVDEEPKSLSNPKNIGSNSSPLVKTYAF